MTTPTYKRHPAKLDALKLTKILETYTIKKVCNDKYFSKKKYRRFLSMELINLTKDCYTCLVKAYHCPDEDRAMNYKQDALLCISAFMAQLDVANNLYDTPIPNIEYWAEQAVDVKESIEAWMINTKK